MAAILGYYALCITLALCGTYLVKSGNYAFATTLYVVMSVSILSGLGIKDE